MTASSEVVYLFLSEQVAAVLLVKLGLAVGPSVFFVQCWRERKRPLPTDKFFPVQPEALGYRIVIRLHIGELVAGQTPPSHLHTAAAPTKLR